MLTSESEHTLLLIGACCQHLLYVLFFTTENIHSVIRDCAWILTDRNGILLPSKKSRLLDPTLLCFQLFQSILHPKNISSSHIFALRKEFHWVLCTTKASQFYSGFIFHNHPPVRKVGLKGTDWTKITQEISMAEGRFEPEALQSEANLFSIIVHHSSFYWIAEAKDFISQSLIQQFHYL